MFSGILNRINHSSQAKKASRTFTPTPTAAPTQQEPHLPQYPQAFKTGQEPQLATACAKLSESQPAEHLERNQRTLQSSGLWLLATWGAFRQEQAPQLECGHAIECQWAAEMCNCFFFLNQLPNTLAKISTLSNYLTDYTNWLKKIIFQISTTNYLRQEKWNVRY